MNFAAVDDGSDFILAMIVFLVPPIFTFIWNYSFVRLSFAVGESPCFLYLLGEEESVFMVS